MRIALSSAQDAQRLSAFYLENAAHLEPWKPLHQEGYHQPAFWRERLLEREVDQCARQGAYFIRCEAESGRVMATCNLSSIVRGAFQACYMGFATGAKFQGLGSTPLTGIAIPSGSHRT